MQEQAGRGMTRGQWLWLLAVLALALGMRLYKIGSESIWYDEAVTYTVLDQPSILAFLRTESTHDPLAVPIYFGSVYLWHKIGFVSIAGVRLMSVAMSLASIALLYAFGRRMFGHVGGIVAALCMSCAKLHVFQGQEIRNYAFTVGISIFAMYALRMAAIENRRGWWWVNIAANLALFYTHIVGLLLLFAQGVFLLIACPRKIVRTAGWAGVHVPFLALFPLWRTIMAPPNMAELNWIPLAHLDRAFAAYYYVFAGSKQDAMDLITVLPFGALPIQHFLGMAMMIGGIGYVLVCALRYVHDRLQDRGYTPGEALLLLVWLFVPPAALFLIGKYVRPCFIERYVFYSSPALYLVVAGAVAALPRRSLQYAAVAVLALIYAGNTVDMVRPLRYDLASPGYVLRDEYVAGEHVYSWNDTIDISLEYYGGVPREMLVGGDNFAELAIHDAASGNRAWLCFFEVPDVYERRAVEALLDRAPAVQWKRWEFPGSWRMYLYRLEPYRQRPDWAF